MGVAWGIVLLLLGALAWLGQAITWLAPGAAERLALTEAGDSVEPVYHADVRAAYALLVICGLTAAITIVAAVIALPTP